jgi:phage-related protein
MLSIAIETILTLISGLLPEFGVASTSVIDKILSALITIVPVIAQNASNFLQPVQNIITALQSQGNLTADQMTQLEALNASCDQAFEAAANAAGLPNPAAPAT